MTVDQLILLLEDVREARGGTLRTRVTYIHDAEALTYIEFDGRIVVPECGWRP